MVATNGKVKNTIHKFIDERISGWKEIDILWYILYCKLNVELVIKTTGEGYRSLETLYYPSALWICTFCMLMIDFSLFCVN